MSVLGRDDILAKPKSATKIVFIPEWNADVVVRRLTNYERDALELEAVDKRTMETTVNSATGYRAKCAAYFLSDENGERLFPDDKDWLKLRDMDGAAIHRIATEGRKFNGMTVQAIEEMEKNSESDQDGGSGSD